MIFVTVGTEQPFDRLIKAIDIWAMDKGRKDVFAQIGTGAWKPRYINHACFLKPVDYIECLMASTIVISHAGMGTIITALVHGKRILVMAKLAQLGEHRNEHQTSTVCHMMNYDLINVARDEIDLVYKLDNIENLLKSRVIGKYASENLINKLHKYIHCCE